MEPIPTVDKQAADLLSDLETTDPTASKNFRRVASLGRVPGEPCSEPDQAADDRARRRDHTSVAINSTPQGLQLQFVDDCFLRLGRDSLMVPSLVYCFCFPTPLLGMTELIPMLEFGMAEPIQVHAVEACIMWPAASRNRTIAPNLCGWVQPCSHGLGEETKLPVNLL